MAARTYAKRSAEFDRGVQFFDAIYGFAITLLITTVHLPSTAAWRSIRALSESGLPSQLFGFVLSFAVIAVFWRENYLLVSTLKAMDSVIIIANIVCAFFIVLITFSTQALHAPSTAGLSLPVALYALNIALASIAQIVMFAFAEHRGLTTVSEPPRTGRLTRIVGRILVPAVFLISIPIAYLAGVMAAQIFWASLLVLAPLLRLAKRHIVQITGAG